MIGYDGRDIYSKINYMLFSHFLFFAIAIFQ